MNFLCIHDKKDIERYFNKNILQNIYCIGDLDDFFWPHTIWYAHKSDEVIDAIVLLYVGASLPTLLAFASKSYATKHLVSSIQHILPNNFYTHLSPGINQSLIENYRLDLHGKHYKMGLMDKTYLLRNKFANTSRLYVDDLFAIQALYEESYLGNWFDKRMLETGMYFGFRKGKRIISIAGIHVYSQKYKVAALGNITTHPDYRGQGYGSLVTSKLCKTLIDEGIHIGLNVKADNTTAISCYRRIGFEVVDTYNEFMATRKVNTK